MPNLNKINVLRKNNQRYPSLLKEIQNPPEKIFILGNLPEESLNQPRIAVVGTRKATNYGKSLAKEIAKNLTNLGAIIVSGLAMGIDTAAHEGAVEAKGKTIAVLANGLDKIYPQQNENLAKKILEFGGAIISEYPAGTPAFQSQFLERNRIISGLSIATIIIEAPERSGSLATARLAIEQGREVFVAPGQTNHPNYKGSHKLIRDGARLITSIEDIIEDLGIEKTDTNQQISQTQQIDLNKIKDKNKLLILEAIQNAGEPLNIDKIIEMTDIKPQIANQIIAFLIIEGIIKETEKGYTI